MSSTLSLFTHSDRPCTGWDSFFFCRFATVCPHGFHWGLWILILSQSLGFLNPWPILGGTYTDLERYVRGIKAGRAIVSGERCDRRVWLHSIEFFRIYIFNEEGWGLVLIFLPL